MIQESDWDVARRMAGNSFQALDGETINLADATGRVLYQDYFSLCNLPTYKTSAMDGYAVSGGGPWQVIGDVKAGAPMQEELGEGNAVGISTGAVIPKGTTGVIRWEFASNINGIIHGDVEIGKDIREPGIECKVGELIASKGTLLTPGMVGFLASAGIDFINVYKQIRAEIILLGDEILTSGIPRDGLIRDALGPQLPGWLARMGVKVSNISFVIDDLSSVVAALISASERSDLVLTTGGTADGARDYLHEAIRNIEGSILIDRVKVRPGHPMLLAKLRGNGKNLIPLLGLPGNPQSAIVGLVSLGEPLIRSLQNLPEQIFEFVETTSKIEVPIDFNRLILGTIQNGKFFQGDYLGSAMLRGLASATGFAIVPSGIWPTGTRVRWLPLP